MKRKVIQLAGKTLVVSLPSKWAEKYNIKKGDELELEDKKGILNIVLEKKRELERKIELDITDLSVPLVWYFINSAYISGANEIRIIFNTKYLEDYKRNKIEIMSLLNDICSKLIGLEITTQSKSSCVLTEITSIKEGEQIQVLKRLFFSVISMGDDIIEAAKNKDTGVLKNIFISRDVNINKLSNYLLKHIVSTQDETNKGFVIYVVKQLEEMGDIFNFISEQILSYNKKIPQELLEICSEVIEEVRLTQNIFFDFKKDKLIEFHRKRREIKDKIKKTKLKELDVIKILSALKSIVNMCMEIISVRMVDEYKSE